MYIINSAFSLSTIVIKIKSNLGHKKVHKTISKTECFGIFSRIRGPRSYKAPPPRPPSQRNLRGDSPAN